jgi:hypothetical protein
MQSSVLAAYGGLEGQAQAGIAVSVVFEVSEVFVVAFGLLVVVFEFFAVA